MSPDLRELFDDAGRTPPTTGSWDPDTIVRRGATARRRRRAATVVSTVAALAVVVGGVALLGPLAPNRTEPGDGPTVTPTPAPSATSAPPTPSGSPSATPSGPTPTATVSACRGTDLVLALGQDGGVAAGTAYLPVVATTSGGSCALGDAPQVQPLGASGAPVGSAAARQQDPGHAGGIVLVPSGHASFLLAFADTTNFDPAACDPVAVAALSLTVTPGTDPVRLPLPPGYTTCRKDVSSLGLPLEVSRWQPTITGQLPETSGSGSASATP
jgi:hypothetical protein